MAKKTVKMPKDFDMLKEIRHEKIYKDNNKRRDKVSRKFLEANVTQLTDKFAIPGQLCLFEYLQPKYEQELEYYDASPVAIIFGKFKNKDGEWRILGWNIHYYPPKIRFLLITRVFEIFKPFYAQHWDQPLQKEITYMQYRMIMDQLTKSKLDFGVRMYIPELITKIRPIPGEHWQKAVFTEGRFRKRTRDAIMNYWRQFISKYKP